MLEVYLVHFMFLAHCAALPFRDPRPSSVSLSQFPKEGAKILFRCTRFSVTELHSLVTRRYMYTQSCQSIF